MAFSMLARLVFSLGIVIGLMWVAATVLKKRGFVQSGKGRPGRGVQVELLARRTLGKNASIAVVRVGERSMVVGVTDHNVTKLDDADIEAIELMEDGTNWTVPTGASSPGTAWKTMLDQMRNRTVRR
jgi:flagellar biosynthetic protein FliO